MFKHSPIQFSSYSTVASRKQIVQQAVQMHLNEFCCVILCSTSSVLSPFLKAPFRLSSALALLSHWIFHFLLYQFSMNSPPLSTWPRHCKTDFGVRHSVDLQQIKCNQQSRTVYTRWCNCSLISGAFSNCQHIN